MAQANLLALSYPQPGTFNIGTGVGTTTNDLYKVLAKITGYPQAARHTVARLGDLKKSLLDSTLAQKQLNWKPAYDLAAGLKETIEYYRKFS